MNDERYDPKRPNDYKLWRQPIESVSEVAHQRKKKERSETTVVVMNMTENYDEECESDLREEAIRYGGLEDFRYQFDQSSENKVKFYLRFQETASAEMFVKSMNGRFYDGRQIIAEFYLGPDLAEDA